MIKATPRSPIPPMNNMSLDFLSVALSRTKRKRGWARITIPKKRIKNATRSI
jgi:hypothetical protein